MNFVEKRVRDENDNDHDKRWFENRMIDVNIQQSIDRVINTSNQT